MYIVLSYVHDRSSIWTPFHFNALYYKIEAFKYSMVVLANLKSYSIANCTNIV